MADTADWIADASDDELVKALCDVDEGLSEWEMNFADSLAKRTRPLTQQPGGQRATVEKILRRLETQ